MRVEPISAIEHYRNFKRMDYRQLYAIIKKRNKGGVSPRNKTECLRVLNEWYNWDKREIDIRI